MSKSHPMTRKYQTHEKQLKTQNFEKITLTYFLYPSCGTVCQISATYLKNRFSKFLKKFSEFLSVEPLLYFMMVGILTAGKPPQTVPIFSNQPTLQNLSKSQLFSRVGPRNSEFSDLVYFARKWPSRIRQLQIAGDVTNLGYNWSPVRH